MLSILLRLDWLNVFYYCYYSFVVRTVGCNGLCCECTKMQLSLDDIIRVKEKILPKIKNYYLANFNSLNFIVNFEKEVLQVFKEHPKYCNQWCIRNNIVQIIINQEKPNSLEKNNFTVYLNLFTASLSSPLVFSNKLIG